MTLYDICMDIAHVENGLAYGEINFSYDKLMCAMKPGHPADILDDIFCDIGNTLFLDKDAKIPLDQIEAMLKGLEDFKRAFKVTQLNKPIKELKEYITQQNIKNLEESSND